MSGTFVYRLERAADVIYLKAATGYEAFELREETERLRQQALVGRLDSEVLIGWNARDSILVGD